MIYQEINPDPQLRDLILCYWKFEVFEAAGLDNEPLNHYILPDGCPSLVFYDIPFYAARGLALFGPTNKVSKTEVFPASIFIGVRFQPGVIGCLFGLSGEELRGKNLKPPPNLPGCELEEVLGHVRKQTVFDKLNQVFFPILKYQSVLPDAVVVEAVKSILRKEGNLRISDLIDSIPLSERQLQKRFKRAVGLTLKEFSVTMRLRSAIIQLELEQRDYHDTIYESGYFDQAHFIRDFSNLSRISLPDFKEYIRNITHVDVEFRK